MKLLSDGTLDAARTEALMVAAFSMQPGRAKCKDPAARGEGRREVSPRPSADEMDPEEDLCCKAHLRFCLWGGAC